MRRAAPGLLVLLVVLASAGAGVGAWRLAGARGRLPPQISVYSGGQLSRVGPFLYCDVLNLNDCQVTGVQGELAVNDRDPIQLAVDDAINRAPWRLMRVYQDPADTTTTLFRPGSTRAVTVATVDPQRGPLSGLVVQLLTLVADPGGELYDVPHAEWSVRAVRG